VTSAPRTLIELQQLTCSEHAVRPALGVRHDGAAGSTWSWLTYRDLGREVQRVRSGLASLGVEPGDRIAIISNNRVEWPIACYAVASLGAVLVPMYEAQRPSEQEFILGDSGAQVVLASRAPIVEALHAMRPRLPGLRHIVGFDLPGDDEGSFAALCRRGEAPFSRPVTACPTDLAEIIYTSGTTGMPKGVMLTHGSIIADVLGMKQAFPTGADERLVSFLPWAHVFGQIGELHHALSVGMSLAINDSLDRLLADLQEVRPTLLVAVPSIFNKIYASVVQQVSERPRLVRKMFRDGLAAAALRREGEAVGPFRRFELALDDKLIFSKIREKLGGRIKWVFSGGAALSREVGELIDAVGVPVHEGYGLTETSCTVALQPQGERRLGTVGKPLPGIRVTIDKTADSDDPRIGEIVVHGPIVMKGYHNQPAATAQAFTADGGLRTGDLGYLDEDGYLVITGRIKEIYKLSNGKYVVPVPIEEQIKLSPYVENVCLYGADRAFNVALVVPNRERLAAWAEREGRAMGDVATDADVLELLAGEIEERVESFPSYQRPRGLIVLSRPFSTENGLLTPTLKVKRHRILQEFAAEIERAYAQALPAPLPEPFTISPPAASPPA
jgi:long-chain acyl-CoA synthetase